jgi:5-methylcytosine-specific restriction endonuclease McrA
VALIDKYPYWNQAVSCTSNRNEHNWNGRHCTECGFSIKRKKGNVQRGRRPKLLLLQPQVCSYCHLILTKETRTTDHIVPLVRGGKNDITNVCWACKKCNSQKGDKLLSEWTNRWYERR